MTDSDTSFLDQRSATSPQKVLSEWERMTGFRASSTRRGTGVWDHSWVCAFLRCWTRSCDWIRDFPRLSSTFPHHGAYTTLIECLVSHPVPEIRQTLLQVMLEKQKDIPPPKIKVFHAWTRSQHIVTCVWTKESISNQKSMKMTLKIPFLDHWSMRHYEWQIFLWLDHEFYRCHFTTIYSWVRQKVSS
jgi:hypothetical protein